MAKNQKLYFILGGVDNEMEEIKRILQKHDLPYCQPQSDWGDIVVDKEALATQYQQGYKYVFIECNPGNNFDSNYKVIDHHGSLSHKPSSLIQLCTFLELKPTLNQSIIASIDSNFIQDTINKFPHRKKLVIRLWESGYKHKFSSEAEWKEFKLRCIKLWRDAKVNSQVALKTAVVWRAPHSNTMIAALADLDKWNCILICGDPKVSNQVPVFFHGNKYVVKKLNELNLAKAYSGRKYFGARAIPLEFVETIKNIINEYGRN